MKRVEFCVGVKSEDGEVEEWYSVSGQFHIIKYGGVKGRVVAFFKPVGWKSFGMGVRHVKGRDGFIEKVEYGSVEEAVRDCEEFFDRYGGEAVEGATL